ncbi:MAG: cell envelope integrity protein TolA, partial [Candidatus Competibacteraceae bacterium]|nr:cell envelope integrity protein TolA [Candidatus Competibacteraceae bacterium]
EAKRKAEEAAARKAEEEARQKLAESLRRAARERAAQGIVQQYVGLIKQKVERFWRLPPGSRSSLSCVLRIRLNEQGVVSDVQIVESSGDALFDRSAVAAVQRASPLPVPDDAEARATFRSFNFKFEPEG